MKQYLVFDIDAEEDLTDTVCTTLFEAVDKGDTKAKKVKAKGKKKRRRPHVVRNMERTSVPGLLPLTPVLQTPPRNLPVMMMIALAVLLRRLVFSPC